MRLTNLGIDKDLSTVVVLGAGASRGSSCARRIGVAPPLDADFFAQAQRLAATTLTKADRELLDFIRQEFGQGDLPTLEIFFTQVSAVDRFHREFNIRGRPSGKFGRHLITLRRLIPRVFNEALGGRDCRWHERIASALRAGDAVMSFNYDTLMDRALKSAGGKRWNPEVGYGFTASAGVELWCPPPRPGPSVLNPILLLKPHGSLNWRIDTATQVVELVDEYSSAAAESIVPPTWDKSDVSNWPWNEVWRSARNVLGLARLLIVLGYSVPITDQMSQALLRADVTKLSALVVANPDPASRRRIIELMSSALDRNAAVVELATLEEFAAYLLPAIAEPQVPDLRQELAELRRELQQVAGRLTEHNRAQTELEGGQHDLKQEFDELEIRIDDLVSTDLAYELQRLRGEVQDLDARIDSMLP